MPRHAIDLTGKVFGRLTVIKREPPGEHGHAKWKCQCRCGNVPIKTGTDLFHGHTQSCGCLKRETSALNLPTPEKCRQNSTTHGMSKTPIWRIWQAMISRCYCQSDTAYRSYGARGITVCSRWRESFENFYCDMGPRPDGLTIERKNNHKGYTPDNCKWATHKEQCRNRRSNRRLTLGGITRLLIEWAEETGIPMKHIHKRLDRGWTVKRALTYPVGPQGQHKRAQGALG